MSKKHTTPVPYVQPYRYPSPNIPLAAIRRFVRRIAERFRPEKIILFGSYAYGTPHNESDVDLLVIMPAYDVINQAIRICSAFDRPFVAVDYRYPEMRATTKGMAAAFRHVERVRGEVRTRLGLPP